MQRCAIALVLLVATFVCYGPSLTGQFLLDDEHLIQHNEHVHSLRFIPEIYTTNVTAGGEATDDFYRPNLELVYCVLYALFGETTTVPYHAVAVTVHVVGGLLLWGWLEALGVGTFAAVAGAALFLLHPVQTEAVAYISGLADLLVAVFVLGALLVYTRALRRSAVSVRDMLGIWALAALALLSKESAVIVAPLALLTLFGLKRRYPATVLTRRHWLIVIGIGALSVDYVLLKATLLNFTGTWGLPNYHNAYTDSIVVRLITFVSVLVEYAEMIFAPIDLFYERPYVAFTTLWTWQGMTGCAVVLAVALSMFFSWRRRSLWWFGAAVAWVAILPVSGILPLNAIYREHWLYAPMIGIALAATVAVAHLTAKIGKDRAVVLVGTLLLLAAARTAYRAADWADAEAFYIPELRHNPDSVRAANNLGMYYASQGNREQALHYYQLAVQTSGAALFPHPHHNLAQQYAEAGRFAEAVPELRAALRIDPNFVSSITLLGRIYLQTGDGLHASRAAAAITRIDGGQRLTAGELEDQLF